MQGLQRTLGVEFNVDAHTIKGNEACGKYFTQKAPLIKVSNMGKNLGSDAVIWCYSPQNDPMPILRKVTRHAATTEGSSAYILCEDKPGSAAHEFLKNYPICHSFPVGTNLFAVPIQGSKTKSFVPIPPTRVVHNVYKVSHDPASVITAKLRQMSISKSQYIFNVRIGRLSVRANTSYKSHILTPEDKAELEDDYMGK